MLRFVPPAGAPLKVREVLGSLTAAASSNGHAAESLDAFARRFQVKYVFPVSSGRAALSLILKSLHSLHPDRDLVAVPAYTCFSVPASVVRSRLKVIPVDVDPNTFELKLEELSSFSSDRILAIIGCNLFGFPSDLASIRKAAEAIGAYVIDDAAQALGATRDGQIAGTLGDVGLYSMGRGKALASLEGGLIVTNFEPVAAAIQTEAQTLNAPSSAHGVRLFGEMLAYSALLHPELYWIPNSLPFLGLGATEFNPSFTVGQIQRLSMTLLPHLLESLNEVNELRRANARKIAENLASSSNFELPAPARDSFPTYIRFPVMARNKSARQRVVSALRNAGIGASAFYPSAICDIPGIEAHMFGPDFHRKNAEVLSERLFTLPVHPLVTQNDLDRMVTTLRKFDAENS